MTWHVLYSSHHSHYIWNGLYRICLITTTLYMVSEQLYVWHHTHFTYSIVCTLHNVTSSLWLHTIVFITLHPLHSLHHTPSIWHQTHGKRYIISAIWPTISNTTSTVSVSSNSRYQLYHTNSLYDTTHTIRVTSYSVSMLSQQLFMTLYPSMYNITPSVFMTSYPVCTLSPYCFHDNTTPIPDISPTIFDITATVSVSSDRWHTHLYRCIALQWHHNKCVSCHIWHTYGNTPNVYHIIFTHFDISDHVLSHHKHCIHDIRYSLYDITSTL